MAELSVPGASRAILIGVSRYEHLEDLPSVDNNLTGLQSVLTNAAIWGLPADQCTVLRQPGSSDAVLDTLQEVGSTIADTLIFYFAGHGLIDPENDDELYLALPRSDQRRTYRTAIPYSWVRREMQAARARRRVVILDCCYSGRALGLMGDDTSELADRLEIEGTCVLTATARTRRALAPPDQPFTAFSGELITLLTEGIPAGPDLLDMDTLYQHLVTRLRARSLPVPQRGEMNRGGNIALARNQAPIPRPVAAESYSNFGAPLSPVTPGSWRQLIDVNHEIETTRPYPAPAFGAVRSALVMVLAIACWAAGAGYVAWVWQPHALLRVAGASGLAALMCAGIKKRAMRFVSQFFAAAISLAAYIFSAVVGDNYWIAPVEITGVILSYGLIIWAITTWKFESKFYKEYESQGMGQQQVAELIKRSRWLTDLRPDRSTLAMFEPLMNVPSARFSCLQNSSIRYVAVAGGQVLLIAFSRQSGSGGEQPAVDPAVISPELQKMADEAETWRQLMRLRHEAHVRVMVIGSSALMTLPSGPTLRGFTGVGITFTTPEGFADAAISFLADGAYQLNLQVLERVYSHLQSTSSDMLWKQSTKESLTASEGQSDSVPQTLAAVLPERADLSPEPITAPRPGGEHGNTDLPALPDPSAFDSVAFDSMRHAASLSRSDPALDTRNTLLAVAQVHVRGRWDRIWLHCGRSPEDIARLSAMRDPAESPREMWNGITLTSTCADALREAAVIARQHDLPIGPGVLVLGLVRDPDTAAARGMGVGVTIEHDHLLRLIQEELLDITLSDSGD